MYYTTANFVKGLINSVINYMEENATKVLPLEFLVNRNDYHSCDAARSFWEHGFRSFSVENGVLMVHGVWDYLGEKYKGDTFDWIVTSDWHEYEPVTKHYNIMTEDALALVSIAYDTLGSIYFTDRGSESWCSWEELDEIEAEYEARRNEVA